MKAVACSLALFAAASVALAQSPYPLNRQFGLVDPGPPVDHSVISPLVLLGQQLFFDTRLSRSGRTACATCHDPGYAFAQPRRVSLSDSGRLGFRNVPSLLNADFLPVLMWDGRFSSLEEQALSPFLRGEMGISVDEAVRRLRSDRRYADLFGIALGTRPTPSGMAGALAAYERTLISEENRFDRAVLYGDVALTPLEQDGLRLFETKAACAICHDPRPRVSRSGVKMPLFTDFRFHNLGAGYRSNQLSDLGRYRVSRHQSDLGAFRTPSLRNVAMTAPYMHDGSLTTLEEVIDFYDAGGRPNPNLSPLIRPLFLSEYDKIALVAFLHSLSGRYEGTAAHGQASGARTPEIPAYLPQLPPPSTKQPVIK
jgi:cytochrome c peroxidase